MDFGAPMPRYAVSRHSDVYSGTAIAVSAVSTLESRYSGHDGGATLVIAYRGTAIAALLYSGAALRGRLLHRCYTTKYSRVSHLVRMRERNGGEVYPEQQSCYLERWC